MISIELKLCLLAAPLLASATIGLAQDSAHFGVLKVLTNKEAVIQLQGSNTLSYRLETAVNLINWEPLATLRGTATQQYTDSFAPYASNRFYRAATLTETNILTGDHMTAPQDLITIHPINHASLVLSWSNITIYCDAVGGATRYKSLPRADLILVTHSHSDHFDSATIDSIKGTNAMIIGPQAVVSGLTSVQRAAARTMTNGAVTTFRDITIQAVPAYNLTNANHPKGAGNGYVLTIGGRRIYISGDTEDIPETRALTNIDLSFVCMNVPFTMSAAKAASTVRQFRPTVVYPYHYQGTSQTDLNAFKRQVGLDLGIEVRFRPWE